MAGFCFDVRTPEEYHELHVRGTSRLIPVEELKKRLNELKGLEDKEIYRNPEKQLPYISIICLSPSIYEEIVYVDESFPPVPA